MNPGLQVQAVAEATSPTPTAKAKKSTVAAPTTDTQDESASTNKTANQAQPAKNLSEYRSVRSIRINRQKAAEQREASQSAFQPSVMDAVYTDKAVQKTWLKYSDQLSDDIHLANGMKTCQPVKVEQHHYEVVVSNPVLQKKLLDNKGAIEAWLHVNLRNSHIKYSVKLDETSAQSRPYTNRDRFEHMVKKNPAMLEFYKQFGLDLD